MWFALMFALMFYILLNGGSMSDITMNAKSEYRGIGSWLAIFMAWELIYNVFEKTAGRWKPLLHFRFHLDEWMSEKLGLDPPDPTDPIHGLQSEKKVMTKNK